MQYIHLKQHYIGAGRSLSCELIPLWSLVCIKIQERLEQSSSRCTVTGLGGYETRTSPGIMSLRKNSHSHLQCHCCWVWITCVFCGCYHNATSCTSVGFLWLKVVLQHNPTLCRHLPKPGSHPHLCGGGVWNCPAKERPKHIVMHTVVQTITTGYKLWGLLKMKRKAKGNCKSYQFYLIQIILASGETRWGWCQKCNIFARPGWGEATCIKRVIGGLTKINLRHISC